MGKILEKKRLNEFLKAISKGKELIAPIKTDTLRFEVIDIKNISDTERICLEGRPLFPIKKFFSPPKEDLMTFNVANKNDSFEIKKFNIKPRIIFGGRLCDFNGLLKLDKLFLSAEYQDNYYKQAREKTLLIGINCIPAPSEFCFCESMNLQKYYDLFFHDLGDKYHIVVGSDKGAELVKHLPDNPNHNFEIPPITCKKFLDKKDLKHYYEDEAWVAESKKCLNCGKCTAHCTTCLCFDIFDEVETDAKSGKRFKEWDSCQFENFTLVAGGYVFRKDYVGKFKHRIYHKLQYFREKFGEDMCTGCGRCIESCPRLIDFTEVINNFKI